MKTRKIETRGTFILENLFFTVKQIGLLSKSQQK